MIEDSSSGFTARSVAVLAVLAVSALVGCAVDRPASEQAKGSESAPPKVERLDLVDRSIEHHGGPALERSTVALTVTSLSGSFDVVVEPGAAFEYQVNREVRGKREVTVHTNDNVTRTLDGQPVVLDGDDQQRARDFVSQRVYFLFLPYRLNDPSVWKQDLGAEDWEGRRLRKVKVSFDAGSSSSASSEYLYWYDPDSSELVQFAYSFEGGLRFRRLENVRPIDGILFADHQNYAIDGSGMSVDVITPDYLRDQMPLLSEIRLTNIVVTPR